jgi:hypothetical protein
MQLIVPGGEEQTPAEVVRDITAAKSLAPFSDVAVEFAVRLSATLMRDPRSASFPELRSLGFWIRKAELTRLRGEFEAMQDLNRILVPRGLVFHVPPANVDTIFVYSWLLALLTGNRNVVRVSTRESEVVEVLCGAINGLLADDCFESIRKGTRFVRYGHDSEITAAFSEIADVRVLWGGDHTVRELRRIPLLPHAKELTFPDRWSLSAVEASSWLNLTDDGRNDLATQFFNDSYWFDQMGCSSPRLVVFCGSPAKSRSAHDSFFDHLVEVVRQKGIRSETGVVLDKILHSHQAAIDQDLQSVRQFSNELTVVQLANLDRISRDHPGGGFFYSACLEDLMELSPILKRQDQTMTVFGFGLEKVRAFVVGLNGAGIDRIVPIGQALNFHRFWDGYDLLQELTRLVHIGGSAELGTRNAE